MHLWEPGSGAGERMFQGMTPRLPTCLSSEVSHYRQLVRHGSQCLSLGLLEIFKYF